MRYQLEDRLIDFCSLVFRMRKEIKDEYFSNYLLNQLLRSSASAAVNYGEAQGAETKRDFVHKIGFVLKELRESIVNIKILSKTGIIRNESLLRIAQDESDQLVSIFYRTAQTAKKNILK